MTSPNRDSIRPFRKGQRSLSAARQLEPLRRAATKGSTGDGEYEDGTGKARRRKRGGGRAIGAMVGFVSTEDHPGTGVAFTINVGTWDSSSHDWGYNTESEYYAIDNRVSVPEPSSGATGLGVWRASGTYGRILEVVDMDCTGDES
jgi:hypothetical protein